jgi:phospholipase A1
MQLLSTKTFSHNNKRKIKVLLILSLFIFINGNTFASADKQENSTHKSVFEKCLFKLIKAADNDVSLADIEVQCEQEVERSITNQNNVEEVELGAIANRMQRERLTAANPYVLTPHKMNYILPVSIVDDINRDAYNDISTWANDLQDIEAKFQLSIKIPLLTGDLFNEGDQIFFSFTLQSWWQIYAEDISRPFRETNYQPEFFYFTPIDVHFLGGDSALVFGFEHQSNGRSQVISRSWNRLYLNYLYETQHFALSLRPWYRIPEGEKMSSVDGKGDDNPDILDYMGHFELGMVYKYSQDLELSFKGRENFATHKGFAEVGITFPLWGKLKGYAQLSKGYGESLIDYNINQTRFGIGIALTNFL